MDTAARWAAPESPIWLLDSERKSNARFKRRPWETESQRSWGELIKGWIWSLFWVIYLCDICSTCVTNRIERQVEWQEVLVGRSGWWENRPNQASALVSYPVISQGQVSDAWPKKRMTWIVWCLCFYECKSAFIWTSSGPLCEICNLLVGLTRCLQRGEGGSSALEEGCPPESQH